MTLEGKKKDGAALRAIFLSSLTARGQNLLTAEIVPSLRDIAPLVAFEHSKVLNDVSNDEVPCHFPIDADRHH